MHIIVSNVLKCCWDFQKRKSYYSNKKKTFITTKSKEKRNGTWFLEFNVTKLQLKT